MLKHYVVSISLTSVSGYNYTGWLLNDDDGQQKDEIVLRSKAVDWHSRFRPYI